MRRAAPRAGVVAAALVAISGCARHATPAECDALLDRYVELLMREQNPDVGAVELIAKKALARDKAAHDSAFAACPQEVDAREIQCAMLTGNVDEFEKCLE
jgi:hypothetical protein